MSDRHQLDVTDAANHAVATEVAEVMQALSTRSRVQILGRLAASPCTVSGLVDALGLEQSAVSHQLQMLRHLDLVVGARRGRNVVYSLHDHHIGDLLRQAVSHTEHRHLKTQTTADLKKAAA